MEVDCNLKKLHASFFKFVLCILEKSLKTGYTLFFLGKKTQYFFLVLSEQFHGSTLKPGSL